MWVHEFAARLVFTRSRVFKPERDLPLPSESDPRRRPSCILSWSKYVVELYSFLDNIASYAHAAHFLAILDYEKDAIGSGSNGDYIESRRFDRKPQRGDHRQARKPTTDNGGQFRVVEQSSPLFPISTLTGHRTLRSASSCTTSCRFYVILLEASWRKIEGTRRDVTRCDGAPLILVAILGLSLGRVVGCQCGRREQASKHTSRNRAERLSHHRITHTLSSLSPLLCGTPLLPWHTHWFGERRSTDLTAKNHMTFTIWGAIMI